MSGTGYETDAVVGRYFVINQGTNISNDIANPVILYLNADGTVVGREAAGTWEAVDGTYYMHITIDGEDYSGVFCQMKDEAGTDAIFCRGRKPECLGCEIYRGINQNKTE